MRTGRYRQTGDLPVVGPSRNPGAFQNRARSAGENESSVASPVKQGTKTNMVPATEKAFRSIVPDRESEFPQQKLRAPGPPLHVRCEQQSAIVGERHIAA